MIVPLAAVEGGAGSPLAILHGLFGSGRNWASIAQRLAEHHRVIAIDLRNHGASPWAETMDYRKMADDVRSTLRGRGHDRFSLLGHSMGGKVAMVSALEDGAAIERLIVVDIAPVAYAVRHLGYAQAMRELDLTAIKRRSDADAALAPAISDAAERAFLLQNLVLEDGRARWRLNLEAIEREMPRLVDFPTMPPGAPIKGQRCSSPAACRTICGPNLSRQSGACFPMPRSRISTMPDIGCMPSSRPLFWRLS
jgi:esterase